MCENMLCEISFIVFDFAKKGGLFSTNEMDTLWFNEYSSKLSQVYLSKTSLLYYFLFRSVQIL